MQSSALQNRKLVKQAAGFSWVLLSVKGCLGMSFRLDKGSRAVESGLQGFKSGFRIMELSKLAEFGG